MHATTLTVTGVGTYTVVDGVMTFVPEANYVGTPPAVFTKLQIHSAAKPHQLTHTNNSWSSNCFSKYNNGY
jgi:hypothetical protein